MILTSMISCMIACVIACVIFNENYKFKIIVDLPRTSPKRRCIVDSSSTVRTSCCRSLRCSSSSCCRVFHRRCCCCCWRERRASRKASALRPDTLTGCWNLSNWFDRRRGGRTRDFRPCCCPSSSSRCFDWCRRELPGCWFAGYGCPTWVCWPAGWTCYRLRSGSDRSPCHRCKRRWRLQLPSKDQNENIRLIQNYWIYVLQFESIGL